MNKLELDAAMARKGMTQDAMASKLGISLVTMNRKINGLRDFKLSEINSIRRILMLEDQDVIRIFFADEVS